LLIKKSKSTEAQIVFAIRQAESCVKTEEVCHKLGISQATLPKPFRQNGLFVPGLGETDVILPEKRVKYALMPPFVAFCILT
jgi:predicted transcriptional regulator